MSRKEHFKELFSFSKSEKNGIIVLLFIIIILLSVQFYITRQVDTKTDFSEFESEITKFESSLISKDEPDYLNRLDKYIIERYDTIKLFKFNPNITGNAEWIRLGLTEKQITTINKYKERGGKFYDKSDFRKIYGIRTKQFEVLKPFIDLPEESNVKRENIADNRFNKGNSSRDIELFFFNLNAVDEKDLYNLGFSEKEINTIINFREKGGVFKQKEDLKKIYGLRNEQYEKVKDYIEISNTGLAETETKVEKSLVDINKLSEKDFIMLGGFWKFNAQRIIAQREKLGAFLNKEQLLDIPGMVQKYYENVKENIIVTKVFYERININFADRERLKKNPYINKEIATKIIDYRDKNGAFKSVLQLKTENLLSQEKFDQVKEYLTI